jgi:hypothetical protein
MVNYDEQIVTRAQAKAKGLTKYFTGKPCSRGHIVLRHTINGSCSICAYENWKKNVAKSPKRKIYERNRVRQAEKLRPIKQAWKKRNPVANALCESKRRIRKTDAQPSWANLKEIDRIYQKCYQVSLQTGILHHVDHIIPLKGKLVCGLHVENNLQIIPASLNYAKGNSFKVDMSI